MGQKGGSTTGVAWYLLTNQERKVKDQIAEARRANPAKASLIDQLKRKHRSARDFHGVEDLSQTWDMHKGPWYAKDCKRCKGTGKRSRLFFWKKDCKYCKPSSD